MGKKKTTPTFVGNTPGNTPLTIPADTVLVDGQARVDHILKHTEVASAPNGKPSSKKTVCPVSRAQFASGAKGVVVVIGGQSMVAEPKVFASGSFGWFVQGSVTLSIDGVPVKTQVGLNLVVANSKDLPK